MNNKQCQNLTISPKKKSSKKGTVKHESYPKELGPFGRLGVHGAETGGCVDGKPIVVFYVSR